MADFVILDGDQALFQPSFAAAVVVVQPGTMSGSGPSTHGGKPVCVVGDEQDLSVPGCMYTTPQYSIPGTGTLKIDSLAADQRAARTKSGGTPLLLKGSQFVAKFEVQSPAMQPPPGPGSPIPDATPQYPGQGSFATTNAKYRAT